MNNNKKNKQIKQIIMKAQRTNWGVNIKLNPYFLTRPVSRSSPSSDTKIIPPLSHLSLMTCLQVYTTL